MTAERQSAPYQVPQRERDVLAGVVGGFIAAAAAGTGILPALAFGAATGTLVGLLERTKKKKPQLTTLWDYDSWIAAALNLPEKSTGEARRDFYDGARKALLAQLREVNPALSESVITRERLALEEAIRNVEDYRLAREEAIRNFEAGRLAWEEAIRNVEVDRLGLEEVIPPSRSEPPWPERARPETTGPERRRTRRELP